jgi:hypothetical protein
MHQQTVIALNLSLLWPCKPQQYLRRNIYINIKNIFILHAVYVVCMHSKFTVKKILIIYVYDINLMVFVMDNRVYCQSDNSI